MLKVELHCHSEYSPDSIMRIDTIADKCIERNIQQIAITDHNTIKGALLAKQMHPELIIVGEEIQTTNGELLAYFIEKEIPKGLDPLTTVKLIHDQGGYVFVPHPFDISRHGWKMEDIEAILEYVNGIEVFNSRALPVYNRKAYEFASINKLNTISGSDAHTDIEIGTSFLTVENKLTRENFITQISQAEKVTKQSPIWIRFYSSFKSMGKRFGNWSRKK